MRMRYRPSTYMKLLRALTIGNLNSLLNFMGRVLPGGNTVRPFLQRLRGVKIGDSAPHSDALLNIHLGGFKSLLLDN